MLFLPGLSDDEVFGTKRKMKIGGKWKCDPEKLAKFSSLGPGKVDPVDAKGECLLEDVVEVDGKPCLRIRIKIDGEKVSFPESPFGVPVDKAKLTSTYWCEVPVEGFSGLVREKRKGRLEALGKERGDSGQAESVVSITTSWNIEVKRKWVVEGDKDTGLTPFSTG